MIEDDAGGWEAVCAAVQRDEWPNAKTEDWLVEQTEQIQASLPDDATRLQLIRPLDAHGDLEGIAQEAGFAVGLQVGRARKGAA